MYIESLRVENFRTFGSEADQKHLELKLGPGLNVLAGENDSGKTAIADAIRHLLWTTSQDYYRLMEEDFHVTGATRASELKISCVFRGLSTPEQAAFLEALTVEANVPPYLCVTLIAQRMPSNAPGVRNRVAVTFRSGKDGNGPAIEGAGREFLRVTFLRPLRDAEAELTGGRNSRLSQILASHSSFEEQAVSDFQPNGPAPQTLVGIMAQADHLIGENPAVTAVRTDINTEYLAELSLGDQALTAAIAVSRRTELRQILEKLELSLDSPEGISMPTRRGLGLNNLLFMATELLLLGGSEGLAFLLIEEPEAHLHPQMQLRLMEILETRAAEGADSRVQILVTTHSPVLASKVDVTAVTVLAGGRAFPLRSDATKLEQADYAFLRRFLDATKANMFFARAVAIVEGDAENILLPVIADKLGRPFGKYGVSIVNVGHIGLFRYSRIFQRSDDSEMPVRVACIADRDIPPDAARTFVAAPAPPADPQEAPRKKFFGDFQAAEVAAKEAHLRRRDGGSVRTFVSPSWTLEHDLALHGQANLMHRAIALAARSKSKGDVLTVEETAEIIAAKNLEIAAWRAAGVADGEIAARVYRPLHESKASKAETAQYAAQELRETVVDPATLRAALPAYLVAAIDYLTRNEAAQGQPNADN